MNATATPHRLMRYRVRTLEFVGETEYPQGHGMRWDDVVVEVSEGERIVAVEQTYKTGRGFDSLLAVVRVVVMSETDDEPTAPPPVEPPPGPRIHFEVRRQPRGRRHRHEPVLMSWTLDDSSWADDPNALEYCACGATRRVWGTNDWREAAS